MWKLKAGAETAAFREKVLAAQGYRCALCGGSFREAKLVKGKLVPKLRPCLDHSHQTGALRGVLCNNCNGVEGKVHNLMNRAKRTLSVIQWAKNVVSYWEVHENAASTVMYHNHKTKDDKRLLANKRARQKRAAIAAAKLIG